jgi:hypothetical protein
MARSMYALWPILPMTVLRFGARFTRQPTVGHLFPYDFAPPVYGPGLYPANSDSFPRPAHSKDKERAEAAKDPGPYDTRASQVLASGALFC